jgi:hypothetical protein
VIEENSGFLGPDVLFNGHVFELTGFKNVATFLAFYELSIFITRDDTHARMPADFLHRYLFGRPFCERWILTRIHIRIKAHFCRCLFTNCGYFKPVFPVVKCFCARRSAI